MSDDIRKALKKAGLASEKDLRRTRHEERVRRTEMGAEGLAEEQQRREQERLAEEARKRQADRDRERAMQTRREEETRLGKLAGLLQEADVLGREGGPRRFFFELPDGAIVFVDVSESLARRLIQGDAAIIRATGVLSKEFSVVSGKAAKEIEQLDRARVLFWNARR